MSREWWQCCVLRTDEEKGCSSVHAVYIYIPLLVLCTGRCVCKLLKKSGWTDGRDQQPKRRPADRYDSDVQYESTYISNIFSSTISGDHTKYILWSNIVYTNNSGIQYYTDFRMYRRMSYVIKPPTIDCTVVDKTFISAFSPVLWSIWKNEGKNAGRLRPGAGTVWVYFVGWLSSATTLQNLPGGGCFFCCLHDVHDKEG